MSEVTRTMGNLIFKNPTEISKQNLVTARIDLVRILPFFGFLIMSTEYHFTKACSTMMATTIGGNKIYVREEFLNTMNRKERAFVILHEILHIFLEHIGRATEHQYDPKLWNVATDFCINSFIIELNQSHVAMPKIGLYDKKWKSMGADEIYHKLLEENDGDAQKACEPYGGGEPQELDEDGNPVEGDGNGSGQRPLDGVSREPMTDAQKTENHQKISASLAQSDVDAIKQMGSGYADLIRELEGLIASVIPWQTVLREFLVTSSKNRYTYDRISRKSYHGGIVFPTMTGENIEMVFGVDTSGSMSTDDLNEAMSELHAICEEVCDSWKLDLVSCDTHAPLIGEYDSEDGDDFTSIDKGLIGGGGTELSPMIEYASDREEIPSVCIIVTDGYIPEDAMDNAVEDVPVLVIVTTAGNESLELNNCTVIHMKDSEAM